MAHRFLAEQWLPLPWPMSSAAWRDLAHHALASVLDRPYIREMCNDYEQHVRWAEYCKMMQALELRIPSRQSELEAPFRAERLADHQSLESGGRGTAITRRRSRC